MGQVSTHFNYNSPMSHFPVAQDSILAPAADFLGWPTEKVGLRLDLVSNVTLANYNLLKQTKGEGRKVSSFVLRPLAFVYFRITSLRVETDFPATNW